MYNFNGHIASEPQEWLPYSTYFLILVTRSWNGRSQEYILITLIPVITSFMTFILLSVSRVALNLKIGLTI